MKEKKFYPDYLSEIIFVVLIAFELLLVIALTCPPPVGRQIDFTKSFQPLPEWYFLWIYQLIRYFPGNAIFVGAVIVPAVFAFLLLAIPYIDKGANGRRKASIVFFGLLLMAVVLTLLSQI
ncbi:MAG: hypothetical protein HQL10_12745 [Nitrospirae bacterium]|nr:hypothetical protein [Nitrospirota bacterium]